MNPHRWRWIALSVFAAVVAMLPGMAVAGRIITPAIVALTLNPPTLLTCSQWSLIGWCMWLNCTPFGCSIEFSVLIAHYNPDLVNSAYHRVGENPWIEAMLLFGVQDAAATAAFAASFGAPFIGTGNRADEKMARSHEDLVWKEGAAIGHPVTTEALLAGYAAAGIPPMYPWMAPPNEWEMCPSETKPLFPYYLPGPDYIGWRLALPEVIFPQSLIPGVREIGAWPTNTWGNVYPRAGYTIASEEPKAGATIAQRVGDIVTRPGQPHAYIWTGSTRLGTTGLLTMYPPPLHEMNMLTGTFQMLVPRPTPACEVFASVPDLVNSWAEVPIGAPPKVDPEGDYAFTLWRPYECCRIKGQTLLAVILVNIWPVIPATLVLD